MLGHIDIVFIKFSLNSNKCTCMHIINFVTFIIALFNFIFTFSVKHKKNVYIKYDYYED